MQSSIACGSCWWWNYLGRTGHRRALYCFSSELLNRSPKGWQNLSLIFVFCQPYFCFENSLLHEPWQSERFLGIASVFVRWNFAWKTQVLCDAHWSLTWVKVVLLFVSSTTSGYDWKCCGSRQMCPCLLFIMIVLHGGIDSEHCSLRFTARNVWLEWWFR